MGIRNSGISQGVQEEFWEGRRSQQSPPPPKKSWEIEGKTKEFWEILRRSQQSQEKRNAGNKEFRDIPKKTKKKRGILGKDRNCPREIPRSKSQQSRKKSGILGMGFFFFFFPLRIPNFPSPSKFPRHKYKKKKTGKEANPK